MTALALSLLGKFWPYIVGALALAFGAFKARQSGANAERLKQQRAEAKARDVASKVDADVGAKSPAEVRKELGKWSKS